MEHLTKISPTPSQKSRGIIPSSEPVLEPELAATIGAIIDRARIAKGWGRLPEKEHDIAVIAWFEILHDAGVPPERWNDCYRSAQQRRSELKQQGKAVDGIIEPNDLAAEWAKIRNMHAEIDKSRLLPENAKGACQRCFGARDDCPHTPLTKEEEDALIRERVQQIEAIRESLKYSKPVAVPPVEVKPTYRKLVCDACGRRVSTLQGWTDGEACGDIVDSTDPEKPILCDGIFH